MNEMKSQSSFTRRSLHSDLVEAIQDLIVDGELTPGRKVPEKQLCERFGVSRTPLREALKVLAADGLIELTPGRGAWVREMTQTEHDEVFPIMAALETLAGELACNAIDNASLAHIEGLHREMVRHYQADNKQDYFKTNQAIHQAIIKAANNETLENLYRGLSARLRRGRYLASMTSTDWAQSLAEHEDILAALKDRNGPQLVQALKTHLSGKSHIVSNWLAEDASTQR